MGKIYQALVRPVVFKFGEEAMHRAALKAGEIAGNHPFLRSMVRLLYYHSDPCLSVTLAGVHYPSVAGLAAGYDKYCQLVNIAPDVSMGHIEVGTFTPLERDGAEKPRLFCMPLDYGLINRMGLNNYGAVKTAGKLAEDNPGGRFEIPVDISLDPNIFFVEDHEEYAEDAEKIIAAREALWETPYAKTINISCPNTPKERSYKSPEGLDAVLQRTDRMNERCPRNTRVKFSPDLKPELLRQCLQICMRHKVHGTIHSNTTEDRSMLVTPGEELGKIGMPGGYSGLRNAELNLDIVEVVHKLVRGKVYIVAAGGIGCNPETRPSYDTFMYLQRGADMVQVLSGIPYYGFDIFREINRNLSRILERKRFSSLEDFRKRRG